MDKKRDWPRWVIRLMCCVLIAPNWACAGELPSGQRRDVMFRATDICLGSEGQFNGEALNAQGEPIVGLPLDLRSEGRPLASCVTDEQGRFSFHGLRPGVYQIVADGTGGVFRLWTPATAPPASRPAALLVQGTVVRGQHAHGQHGMTSGMYDGALMKTLSNPWVFSGLLAAGVAVPLALSQNDDADGS